MGVLEAVTAAVGTFTVGLDSPDTALRVMKRRLRDADLFLLFNEGPQATAHTIRFAGKGKPELWDPQTAGITDVKGEVSAGGLAVKIPLEPFQTKVVVIRE